MHINLAKKMVEDIVAAEKRGDEIVKAAKITADEMISKAKNKGKI